MNRSICTTNPHRKGRGMSRHALIAVLGIALWGSSFSVCPVMADDWPQWRGPQRDGVWREEGIVDKLPEKLEYKWRVPVGLGYAGPAVVGNRVFVTDRKLSPGNENPADPFSRDKTTGVERVLCLNAESGETVWQHEYPCEYSLSYPFGPRATPTIADDRVYSLGAMGDLFCLDAESGKVIWHKNFVRDYGLKMNTWGTSSAPLVLGDKLICIVGGSDKRAVMALNRDTGETIWHALDVKDPGYSAPEQFKIGDNNQLIVWTAEWLASLNSETGKVNWQEKFPLNYGMSIATPIYSPKDDILLVSAFYNGSLAMKMNEQKPTASILWKGTSESEINTEGLHCCMSTPAFVGDYLYGVDSYGQLRCLKAETGERLWETYEATGRGRWWNAFLVRVGDTDKFFLNNEQGDLIIARLTPKGYEEISRAFLIEPTNKAQRRKVVWSHPAYANKSIYARNDKEIVCVDLAAKK